MSPEPAGSAGGHAGAPSPAPWPRTWLFAPADDRRKLDSALRSGAQALIADLEDAVAPERKELAREQALQFLDGDDGRPRMVRINDPHDAHGRLDLERLGERSRPVVMVPKASLATLELAHAAGVRTIALIETARGVAEVEQIAMNDGVVAIAIGNVDLAAELGLLELPDGLELLHIRSRLVLACALGAVPAIDGVHVAIGDSEGLDREARRARALGFAGKLCIHPAQLETVLTAFTPSADERERARRILDAYERALAQQRGTALADGEMVDLASVRRAERILHGENAAGRG